MTLLFFGFFAFTTWQTSLILLLLTSWFFSQLTALNWPRRHHARPVLRKSRSVLYQIHTHRTSRLVPLPNFSLSLSLIWEDVFLTVWFRIQSISFWGRIHLINHPVRLYEHFGCHVLISAPAKITDRSAGAATRHESEITESKAGPSFLLTCLDRTWLALSTTSWW